VADNLEADPGSGGATLAADDIASVFYPRGKLSLGADGTAVDAVAGAGAVDTGTQRVTLASDDPAVALLTTIDSDTNTIQGDTTTIAGAVSGSEMQVDVVASLPAGSNGIGDVGVTAVVPGTGPTSLGKAQDTAVGATDTGIAMLAVRDDEQGAMTPADGDYSTLRTDKFGNLKVTNKPDATSEPKYGVINVAGSGDNTLQAAAGAGIKIRVTSAMLVATGAVSVRFESGASGTALTGVMPLVASSGFTLPYNPDGWFETADNALLNLELSAAESVDGCFTYVEV